MPDMISCITLSTPSRWGLLQRAMYDFARQTYGDREMLIIVKDANYADHIDQFADNNLPGQQISAHQRAFSDTALGNIFGVMLASGSLITYWDDDNQNHTDRLEAQIRKGRYVSVLGTSLYYFYESRELYFVNYGQPSAPLTDRCAITSMIARRSEMPTPQLYYRSHYLQQMLADAERTNVPISVLDSPEFHHLVGVRGDNKRGYEAHRRLATRLPMTFTKDMLIESKPKVLSILDAYTWDDGDITVCGRDGDAFVYSPKRKWPSTLFPVLDPKDGVNREDVVV